MTDGAPALGGPGGLPEDELALVLAKGADKGLLTQDDLVGVLKDVELSADLIDSVIERVQAASIAYVEDPDPGHSAPVVDALVETLLIDHSEVCGAATSDPAVPTSTKALSKKVPKTPPRGGAKAGGRSPTKRVPPAAYDDGGLLGPGADPVRAYLKEIGKVPLLTPAREVTLARRITEGQLATEALAQGEIEGATPLPAEESDVLRRQVTLGLQAKKLLVESNLRLVVSVAKRYRNRGMALLDLIQEGNLGLMRAAEKFDYTKGFKFSTYATWWIRQAITRAIADQARTIRIPVHMVEIINKVVRTQRQLSQDLGREPTLEELALRAEVSLERVREIQRINQDTVSLEQPVGDDNFQLSDMIADQGAILPAEAAARALLNEAVKDALAELGPREQEVVRLRFGLEDGQMRTLEEVGQVFGITRERVRQIESKTLAKLRNPMRAQPLREYLEDE